MSIHPLRTAEAGKEITSYLADREGLAGTARTEFCRLVDSYGGFRRTSSRRSWPMLLLVASVISGLCCLFDAPQNRWLDTLIWPASFMLSIASIWFVRLREIQPDRLDDETEWRAYCLFLRPLILSEHPGLLDRNHMSSLSASTRFVPRPVFLLREQMIVRGLDCWWSTLVGTWAGTILGFILRHVFADSDALLSLLLPAGGFLLGPAVWALGQSVVYSLAQRTVDDA